MTDAVAKERYVREANLAQLERDIRFEVMRGRPWQMSDLRYLDEAERLIAAGTIGKTASFWSTSPHPPVYRAIRRGAFRIGNRRYGFKPGQEIVWACPMLRDLARLDGPVFIANFQSAGVANLCGAMANAMKGAGMQRRY